MYKNEVGDKTLLLVEDEECNIRIMKCCFNNYINIKIARNGKECVDFIKNNCVDMILMDYEMPVMNGMEAAKQVRNMKPDIPIVLYTACNIIELINSLKNGEFVFDDFLYKPAKMEVLQAIVDKYVS